MRSCVGNKLSRQEEANECDAGLRRASPGAFDYSMREEFQQAITNARASLRQNQTLVLGEDWFRVRTLLDVRTWRIRRKGSETYDVFGEDDCGNEYVTAHDGRVFFWEHETGDTRQVAESLPAVLNALGPQPEIKLKPGQLKKVWVDPAFLEQQKRLENTKE